jgi:hypothetical protein
MTVFYPAHETRVRPPRRKPGTFPVAYAISETIRMLGREGTPVHLTAVNAPAVMESVARLLIAFGVTPWVPDHDRSPGARRVRKAVAEATADALSPR